MNGYGNSKGSIYEYYNTYYTTLKDFKNAKIEIHKINNFLMYQFYWNLAKININISGKHDLNFISK